MPYVALVRAMVPTEREMTMTKIRRPAFTHCIQHKSETDIRVLYGNRIISRHSTVEAARLALDAIFASRALPAKSDDDYKSTKRP